MRRYASLRGRREFALVLRRGRAVSAKHLVLFALRPDSPQRTKTPNGSLPRVGIVITKKVGGAVERNRLRRRCKAILDASIAGTALWYVVQMRPSAAQLTYEQLREQLCSVLATGQRTAGEPQRRRERNRS